MRWDLFSAAELAAEVWRPVWWAPNYTVSNLGRVRSPRCVLRRSATRKSGYLKVNIHVDGEQRTARTHVLVLEAFIGQRPLSFQAAHADGDRSNSRLCNLSWKTPKQNAADKKVHGTEIFGSRNGNAHLTEETVREIRKRVASGEVQKNVAASLRMSPTQVSRIARQIRWPHLAQGIHQ